MAVASYRGLKKYCYFKGLSDSALEAIYNKLISLHKWYYKIYGKYLNKYKLSKWVTTLKKKDNLILFLSFFLYL